MNKLRPLFLFATAALLTQALCSCGDDSRFEAGSVPVIGQYIYMLPERSYGEPYNYGFPSKRYYLDTGEVIKFAAAYSLGDVFITSDEADLYILGKNWDVDGNNFNLTSFRYSFEKAGRHLVILQSTDLAGDTITDTAEVYVNTPISVTITSPENGNNLVDPHSKEGVDLKWVVQGTDEWETASCGIFASLNKDDVWESLQATGACNKNGHISGPLFPQALGDSSVTVYWGIAAINSTNDGFSEEKKTPIYHFTTKFVGSDSARITIPIYYDNLWGYDRVNTQITVVNSSQDTIGTYNSTLAETSFDIRVLPQSGLHIYLEETMKTDFQSSPYSNEFTRTANIEMNVTAPSLYTTDTVVFYDKTPPVVTPLQNVFSPKDKLAFYILDNGSAVNPSHISVITDFDTLAYTFEPPIVTFENPCAVSCNVKIIARDYSRNETHNIYWHVDNSADSASISGPFLERGM